ncbi:type II toxin-antitoxin system HicB family antitoxin [Geoalkalibacter sp.]|jgi:predicted HicB family RNase H-like nuclease|uniref:type II toxin-antitoxin system HicB family antitoxin n=1 Tax=Geoalkalibacter sp. TaxID=3041440 RepID=UPI00272E134E|nr:type II toxin-antitoxin system HicB family antitoxin [Geoalkalibacter sp.]
MSKPLTYRGYAAHIEFDAEDRLFVGRVAGIVDIVTFHGESVGELEQAFHEAVDGYLSLSEKLGRPPQKPCSGRLMLRIPPEVHARALMMAEAHGKSLNQWAADVLAKAE